jgi:hypothetical protein
MSLTGANPSPLTIPSFAPEELNFLESVEAAHSSHSFAARVAQVLDIKKEPTRMDSQAKYCALVRGDGGAYLRMPTGVGYVEKIWVCSFPFFVFGQLSETQGPCRIMRQARCLWRKLVESSPTREGSLWTLVWAGLSVRTMGLLLQARRRMVGSLRLFGRRRRGKTLRCKHVPQLPKDKLIPISLPVFICPNWPWNHIQPPKPCSRAVARISSTGAHMSPSYPSCAHRDDLNHVSCPRAVLWPRLHDLSELIERIF